MSFLDKLFGSTTKKEEVKVTKLNIGIILGAQDKGE